MSQNLLYHRCVYKSLGTFCHILNITNIYTTVLTCIAFFTTTATLQSVCDNDKRVRRSATCVRFCVV